jgi:hypothetical protein
MAARAEQPRLAAEHLDLRSIPQLHMQVAAITQFHALDEIQVDDLDQPRVAQKIWPILRHA